MSSTSLEWDSLFPQPVPENICQVKVIVADIYHTVEKSLYIPDDTKVNLKQCTRQLEAECSKSTILTQLVYRAANDSENVLSSRIRFLDSLEDRIKELLKLRENFKESRKAFGEQPNRDLTTAIKEAKHRAHDGMLSKLRPLFKDIQTYYEKIRVSLYAEKERLEKINRSRRVTPDDRCRWEYIRDACKEAYDLLTSETSSPSPSTPPNTPQPANNNASRDIKALAQAVEKARGSLSEACRDIKEHTRGLQPGILRLQSEYKNGVETCQGRINELLEFSESFLNSIPQVLQRDDFRDHLLPSAPASSDQILQEVGRQVKSSRHEVLSVFPELKGQFDLFDHSLPIADKSMQRMYHTLQDMVRHLEQQDDALTPAQLGEPRRKFADLKQQWRDQLQSTS